MQDVILIHGILGNGRNLGGFAKALMAMLKKPHPQTEYHFVRAEHGRGFSLDLSSQVFLHDLANAGHWVHVDNLSGLLEIIARNTLHF